jgi:hypothetical protein
MNIKQFKKLLKRVPSNSEITITDTKGNKYSFSPEQMSYKLYSNSDQWEVNITLKDEDHTESYQEMSLGDALDKLLGLKGK